MPDTSLWIGGTDVFSEGYWVWSGSKIPVSEGFTNWGPGEPNHAGGETNEDCMQLYAHKSYTWNDEDCRLNARFVCEVRSVHVHSADAGSVHKRCMKLRLIT